MTEGLRVTGAEDFDRLAAAMRAADKATKRRISARLRKIAKPLAEDVRREGADPMPQRGGLAARLAAASLSVRSSYASRGARVEIALRTRERYALARINEGELRHPVFGGKAWVEQSVPAGSWTEAILEGGPDVQRELHDEVRHILAEISAGPRITI